MNAVKKLYLVFALLIAQVAVATPVGPMSFQGRLLDDQGVPVTGTYNFKVRIYDDPTVGSIQYSEDHDSISVDDGVYSLKVGTGTNPAGVYTWEVALWQNNLNNLFMEVEVDTEILAPRHELTSAPHAYTATLALSADSLGASEAAKYENIMEGICVTAKGKWLISREECAGGNADLSNLTPADFDDDPNFSNLVFQKTDFTGTSFYSAAPAFSADFSDTRFEGSTFDNTDFTQASFDDAVFDGVVVNTGVDVTGATFNGAIMKNFDASNLDLSTANINGLAAGRLTACPSALPAGWVCKAYNGGTLYALSGPGVNFSGETPAINLRYGAENLAIETFDGGDDLTGANFSDMLITSSFDGSTLSDTDFGHSLIRRASIKNLTADRINLNSTILENVWLENLSLVGTVPAPIDLQNTSMTNVTLKDITLSESKWNGAYLTNTTLDNVSKDGVGARTDITLQKNVFRNVEFIDTDLNVTASQTRFVDTDFISNTVGRGELYGAFNVAGSDYVELDNVLFSGIEIGSTFDFSGADFKSATFDGVTISSGIIWPADQARIGNLSFHDSTLSGLTLPGRLCKSVVSWKGSDLSNTTCQSDGATSIKDVDFSSVTATSFVFNGSLTNPDFSNASLTSADFTGATITKPNWTNATLSNIQLAGSFTYVDFSVAASASSMDCINCSMSYTNFSGLNLFGSDFTDAYMYRADFSGTTLNSVQFDSAYLAYANFSDITFYSTDFTGASLYRANLSGSDLTSAQGLNLVTSFAYANIQSADFSGITSLSSRNFSYANGVGSNFSEVSLTATNFYRANLSNADLSTTTGDSVSSAQFDFAEMSGADLSNRYVYTADFYYANLRGAIFSSTYHTTSRFYKADLSGADFTNADFSSSAVTDFSYADLTGADFTGATFNGATKENWIGATCPDGYKVYSQTFSCQDGHL